MEQEPEKPSNLPPVDPERFSDAMRRVLTKPRPPGGWPGKPPKEVRAEDDREDGE